MFKYTHSNHGRFPEQFQSSLWPQSEPTITGFRIRDLRTPTSLVGIGIDPMNSAGEQSLACVFLE